MFADTTYAIAGPMSANRTGMRCACGWKAMFIAVAIMDHCACGGGIPLCGECAKQHCTTYDMELPSRFEP